MYVIRGSREGSICLMTDVVLCSAAVDRHHFNKLTCGQVYVAGCMRHCQMRQTIFNPFGNQLCSPTRIKVPSAILIWTGHTILKNSLLKYLIFSFNE